MKKLYLIITVLLAVNVFLIKEYPLQNTITKIENIGASKYKAKRKNMARIYSLSSRKDYAAKTKYRKSLPLYKRAALGTKDFLSDF